MFPPDYLEPPNAPNPGFHVNSMSGFVRLLPYLEQRPLYDAINIRFIRGKRARFSH